MGAGELPVQLAGVLSSKTIPSWLDWNPDSGRRMPHKALAKQAAVRGYSFFIKRGRAIRSCESSFGAVKSKVQEFIRGRTGLPSCCRKDHRCPAAKRNCAGGLVSRLVRCCLQRRQSRRHRSGIPWTEALYEWLNGRLRAQCWPLESRGTAASDQHRLLRAAGRLRASIDRPESSNVYSPNCRSSSGLLPELAATGWDAIFTACRQLSRDQHSA